MRLKREPSSLPHSAAPAAAQSGCAAPALLPVPAASPAASFSASPLGVCFNRGCLCTWVVCWASQSLSVPLFGCSRSISARTVLRPAGKAGLSLLRAAGPGARGELFPALPAARSLGTEGTQLSRSHGKLSLADYAVLCVPGATSVYGRGIAKARLPKARPGRRWPRLQEHESLGWFPDSPVSAGAGSNAGRVRLAGSAAVPLSSVGSRRCQHGLGPARPGLRSQGGFPAALGIGTAATPAANGRCRARKAAASSVSLPPGVSPAQFTQLMVRAAPKRRRLQPRGRTRCSAALRGQPRHRAGAGKGQIERELGLLPK